MSGLPDLTGTVLGLAAVAVFLLGYAAVVSEEFSHVRKSKPVIIAAGVIWVLVAIAFEEHGERAEAARLLRENLLEFAELMLFLLAAMTYINTMQERNVFRRLQYWLVTRRFSLRGIYWLTGLLAFCISPMADNLTTALLMGAVILAVGAERSTFVAVSCINIVVAANAGGAFSPFGDITTLMVWQRGVVPFWSFFALFLPALVNWLVPAALMARAVPASRPKSGGNEVVLKRGAITVVLMFGCTIALTVALHQFLHLPPFLGMMSGLGVLNVYGYFLRREELKRPPEVPDFSEAAMNWREYYKPAVKPFDVFISFKRVEWDTLMFFYGVVLCVGGLSAFGYLASLSVSLYQGLGATAANVLIGLASAVIDNIPIMYAVLHMNADMPLGQWLLVTLTAGVGGSLLSIGSAAGVALMGQARQHYTFFSHLKWTWAVALGYALSILVHFAINGRTF